MHLLEGDDDSDPFLVSPTTQFKTFCVEKEHISFPIHFLHSSKASHSDPAGDNPSALCQSNNACIRKLSNIWKNTDMLFGRICIQSSQSSRDCRCCPYLYSSFLHHLYRYHQQQKRPSQHRCCSQIQFHPYVCLLTLWLHTCWRGLLFKVCGDISTWASTLLFARPSARFVKRNASLS